MTEPLSVGLIGCGRAAERLHVPAFRHVPEARLVAAADPIAERRDLIASRVRGCRAFPSAPALLERGAVAAVIIASPEETHLSLAALALRAGVSILVEKPLARSLAEASQLQELQAASGAPVMAGFNRRRWAPVARLRQILAVRHRAEPLTIATVMTSDVHAWSPIAGVRDPLDDLASHHIDLLRYLTGRDVVAISAARTGSTEIRLQIRLDGGSRAACMAAQARVSRETITVHAGESRYEVRMGSERVGPVGAPARPLLDFVDKVRGRLRRRRPAMSRSYEDQLRSFVQCCRARSAPEPGITDGIAVLRAVEAARVSAFEQGREVLV